MSASELRALDVLARLAADLIERARAEEALTRSEQRLVSIYNTVKDVIFDLAVELDGQFRFVSVNASFLKATGLSREMVIGRTVEEVIPEPSLTMVVEKYRLAIEEGTAVFWEETSEYPTGRLTGEVAVVPVFDNRGICTHLVGSVHDITERKRAEAALQESERQLRSLAGSLLTSQEEERRRVSRELHDELLQRLAWLAMELGSVAGELSSRYEGLKTRIQTLQRAVVEVAESTRHMAYRLHPGELDDLGLAAALRVYCHDFSRDGLAIEFTSSNLPESIDREVASCLYRVVQESLRNVVKHANARKAWVTLEGSDHGILLHVRDAGVGFPVESLAAGGGLGVISMKERVRNLNGSFEIQSTPTQGTVITVKVPQTNARTSTARP